MEIPMYPDQCEHHETESRCWRCLAEIVKRLSADLEARAEAPPESGCVFCHNRKGGTPGNENVICGKTVCDYCTVILHDMGVK